jgi:hypothetical protein
MASTYDEATQVRERRHDDGRGNDRDVKDWARGLPSERPPRGLLDRRRWVETKWSFKTTELLTLIVASLGLLITALTSDSFGPREAWRLGVALAVGYMLSRGIAKAGKGTYDDD